MQRKWMIASLLILVELGLCAGILAISWTGFSQFRNLSWRVLQLDTYSAEAYEEQSFTVTTPADLLVDNPDGLVHVTGGPGSAIVVKAHKKAWGPTQAEAQAAVAALKLDMTLAGDTVTVKRPADKPVIVIAGSSRGSAVDLTISVPITTLLKLSTDFGNLTVSATRGDADLQNHAGSIRVSDTSGKLKLQSRFGGITVERVTASVLDAQSDNGSLNLADVQVDGAVTLGSRLGPIAFKNGQADSLTVNHENGGLALTQVTVHRAVTTSSRFGNLTLDHVQAASLALETDNGKIRVDGASGPIQAKTRFGSVDIKNAVNANLDLSSENGALTFSGSLGDGPHTLATNFGGVHLSLPRDAALTLDLKTDFGKVQSDLPIVMTGGMNPKHWTGTTNGGGARLNVTTKNGNISLNTLVP